MLEIIIGRVCVNHQLVLEDHPVQGNALDIGRGTLASGRYALVGDNRGLPNRVIVSAIVSKNGLLGNVVYRS